MSAPPGDDDSGLWRHTEGFFFEAGRRGRREPGDLKPGFAHALRSEWARVKGRAGGKAKGAAYEDKRVSARLMKAQGMSLRAIARELGVNHQSVANWTREVSK